jgi:hypothetical protein
MTAIDVVDAYFASLPALAARRLDAGEWGIQVPGENAGGKPVDVGLRLADGLLRAQAVALPGAGDLDPWMLLWWNRQTRIVRFGSTRSKDVWVHADLPAVGLDERALDRLLGLVCEAVMAVRGHADRARSQADAGPRG